MQQVTNYVFTANSVSELVDFISGNVYTLSASKSVFFQGELLEITATTLDYTEFMITARGRIYSISASACGYFDLHCLPGIIEDFNNSYLCIVVPDYCKKELIEELKALQTEMS